MSGEKREVRGFRVIDLRYTERRSLDRHAMELHVECKVLDRATGEPNTIAMRELIPLYHWERQDAKWRARQAREMCRKALEHELDECFYVDGVRVYDPHEDEGTDANGAPV